MAIEQRFTELPTVANSTMDDIICAVQGYVSPSNLGLSTQQTLSQVLALFQSNTILFNTGNPNGVVAGTTFQLCWDTVNSILYVCTTSGTTTTAVWSKSITLTAGSGITIAQGADDIVISSSASGTSWNEVTTTSAAMLPNNGYITNNGSLVSLSLPATATIGSGLYIVGKGVGGWEITQGAGQQINIGSVASTLGAGGSVASTNQFDSLTLLCTETDTIWTALGAPQTSGLTIV